MILRHEWRNWSSASLAVLVEHWPFKRQNSILEQPHRWRFGLSPRWILDQLWSESRAAKSVLLGWEIQQWHLAADWHVQIQDRERSTFPRGVWSCESPILTKQEVLDKIVELKRRMGGVEVVKWLINADWNMQRLDIPQNPMIQLVLFVYQMTSQYTYSRPGS